MTTLLDTSWQMHRATTPQIFSKHIILTLEACMLNCPNLLDLAELTPSSTLTKLPYSSCVHKEFYNAVEKYDRYFWCIPF